MLEVRKKKRYPDPNDPITLQPTGRRRKRAFALEPETAHLTTKALSIAREKTRHRPIFFDAQAKDLCTFDYEFVRFNRLSRGAVIRRIEVVSRRASLQRRIGTKQKLNDFNLL
jgi:hypothetical protein